MRKSLFLLVVLAAVLTGTSPVEAAGDTVKNAKVVGSTRFRLPAAGIVSILFRGSATCAASAQIKDNANFKDNDHQKGFFAAVCTNGATASKPPNFATASSGGTMSQGSVWGIAKANYSEKMTLVAPQTNGYVDAWAIVRAGGRIVVTPKSSSQLAAGVGPGLELEVRLGCEVLDPEIEAPSQDCEDIVLEASQGSGSVIEIEVTTKPSSGPAFRANIQIMPDGQLKVSSTSPDLSESDFKVTVNGDVTTATMKPKTLVIPISQAPPFDHAFRITTGATNVGGIAELPEVAGTPLETDGSSGGSAGVLAGAIAGAVLIGGVTLGGAAWYTRRRWIS